MSKIEDIIKYLEYRIEYHTKQREVFFKSGNFQSAGEQSTIISQLSTLKLCCEDYGFLEYMMEKFYDIPKDEKSEDL